MAVVTPPDTSSSESAQDTAHPETRRRIPFLGLALLVGVVALAGYIGVNVLTVLFAVVSPPLPPMPANLVEISHENVAYGVDRWRYTSTEDACSLVKFLEDNSGVCVYAPLQCATNPEQTNRFAADGLVARCDGSIDFSIFTMNWFGLVVKNSDSQSRLDLDREVFWLGTGRQ